MLLFLVRIRFGVHTFPSYLYHLSYQTEISHFAHVQLLFFVISSLWWCSVYSVSHSPLSGLTVVSLWVVILYSSSLFPFSTFFCTFIGWMKQWNLLKLKRYCAYTVHTLCCITCTCVHVYIDTWYVLFFRLVSRLACLRGFGSGPFPLISTNNVSRAVVLFLVEPCTATGSSV